MRSRVDVRALVQHIVWASLILATAGYGAVVVRNITDTLVQIVSHPPSETVLQRPNR